MHLTQDSSQTRDEVIKNAHNNVDPHVFFLLGRAFVPISAYERPAHFDLRAACSVWIHYNLSHAVPMQRSRICVEPQKSPVHGYDENI